MALTVDTIELGPVGTNCHLVRAEQDGRVVVVDPSGSAADIRLHLGSSEALCDAILLTHCHWDHFVGLAELETASDAPVWLPGEEEWVFRNPGDVYRGLGITIEPYLGEATLVTGGESVVAGGIPFEVIAVPGHSPGHVAYYTDGHLFSGDVLFAGGVGRVDLPGGDWATLLRSIRTLVDRFPADTIVHSGHGPDTSLGVELARNPFLAELRAARSAGDD